MNATVDKLAVGAISNFLAIVLGLVTAVTVALTTIATAIGIHHIVHYAVTNGRWTITVARSPYVLVNAVALFLLILLPMWVQYLVAEHGARIYDRLCLGVLPGVYGRHLVAIGLLSGIAGLTGIWFRAELLRDLSMLEGIFAVIVPTELPGNEVTFTAAVLPLLLVCSIFVFGDSIKHDREDAGNAPESDNSLSVDSTESADTRTESGSNSDHTGTPNSNQSPEDRPSESAGERDNDPSTSESSESSDEGSTNDEVESDDADENTQEVKFDWVFETGVSFDDVGGMADLKEELRRDVILPMKEDSDRAAAFDIPLPNILLYGPPGTGKSHIAQALGTELEYPFVSIKGADILCKWVNGSTEKVNQLFKEAHRIANREGGAVIFIDEIDTILPARRGDTHEENRKVVNEMLTHLQESARNNILFVGATNRREDLDEAATRNGRIDKEIHVGDPDLEARRAIFQAQLSGRPNRIGSEELDRLALTTDGFVASDITAVVDQAARNALFKRDGDAITWEDMIAGLESIIDN